MSKQTEPTPKGEAQGSKLAAGLAHMQKLIKARLKAQKGGKAVLTMLAFALGIAIVNHFFKGNYTPSMAALYAFANDGVISGRQSNSVKTRNGVERMFVVPRLVRSTFTTVARGFLSGYSAIWNNLTDSQRNSWSGESIVNRSNRLGRSFRLKGKALYVATNINIANALGSAISSFVPYTGVSFGSATAINGTITGTSLSALTVAFDPSPVPADTSYLIFMTGVMSPGTMRPKESAFKMIQTAVAADTTPVDVLAAFGTRYGLIASAGQKIYAYLKCVNVLTGESFSTGIVSVTL